MREDVRDYLELGSWEGQSSVFAGWLFPKAKIIAVDWFANVQANDRFDRNTASFSNRLEKIKGTTVDILMRFAQEGRTFDFIYVDADHCFDGVLLDTILSWPLLRKGGYLVWDDYLWTHPAVPHLNPKRAIDAWLASRRDSIDVVFAGYQVCVQKIADDTQITDMAYWN
jgi:predicted O-methyltransferase YrrM